MRCNPSEERTCARIVRYVSLSWLAVLLWGLWSLDRPLALAEALTWADEIAHLAPITVRGHKHALNLVARGLTPEAKKLADICVACCEKVKAAVGLLSNMDNATEIMTLCSEIDRLESEADHVMRDAIARLFRDEPDVRELIKLRSVYEHLETVTDRCEDVANIIQGIVIENS